MPRRAPNRHRTCAAAAAAAEHQHGTGVLRADAGAAPDARIALKLARPLAVSLTAVALLASTACSGDNDTRAADSVHAVTTEPSASENGAAEATNPQDEETASSSEDGVTGHEKQSKRAKGTEKVVDKDLTYAPRRVDALRAADVTGMPAAKALAIHHEYGQWLLDISFQPDMINVKAPKLPESAFAPATAKMTPELAAEWWENVSRRGSEDAQANLFALMYFGYANQPDVNGPPMVNLRIKDVAVEAVGNGLVSYRATAYAEFRSTKKGKPVRWPYENKVGLTLDSSSGAWKIRTWSGVPQYLDPIWEQ